MVVAWIDHRTGLVARLLVRFAAKLLPRAERARYAEEWLGLVVEAGESGVRPLRHAASLVFLAAPRMAVSLRRPFTHTQIVLAICTCSIPVYFAALPWLHGAVAHHAAWVEEAAQVLLWVFLTSNVLIFGLNALSKLDRFRVGTRLSTWIVRLGWAMYLSYAAWSGFQGAYFHDSGNSYLGVALPLFPILGIGGYELLKARYGRRHSKDITANITAACTVTAIAASASGTAVPPTIT